MREHADIDELLRQPALRALPADLRALLRKAAARADATPADDAGAGDPPAALADTLAALSLLNADGDMLAAAILHAVPELASRAEPDLALHPAIAALLEGQRAAGQVWALHAEQDGRGGARRPAPAAARHRARPARGADPAGAAAGADARGRRAARRRTPRAGAADPRHPRAARQPARHLAIEVGTGGPGVPPSRTRHLPAHRAPARRQALGARALHRAGQEDAGRGARRAGRARRGRGTAQAHLQHLEEDAEEERADRRTLRSARGARTGRRRAGLLRRARCVCTHCGRRCRASSTTTSRDPSTTTTVRCTPR